ncbi:MAG: cardiolipin synthase [Planctomycetota bacterium]|nr:cardiolipin synthase [Planctomycetota bacterium]
MIPEGLLAGLGVAVFALDVFSIVRAISRDHGVERTLAWIFAILALPGIGALVYLILASPNVKRIRQRKLERSLAVRSALPELDPDALTPTSRPLFTLASRLTGIEPTPGNMVRFLVENEGAFERIEEAIRGAQHEVLAEYYLVRNDATGHRFLDLLTDKAAEGVDVRLIYDGVGSMGLDPRAIQRLRAAGGQVVEFLPPNPLRKRWAVHLRNHRKLVLVDGAVAFTGGMNIGDEYSGRSRRGSKKHFRDTHLELIGPAVAGFLQVFREDWSFAADEVLPERPEQASPKDTGGSAWVSALPSGPDQQFNATLYVYHVALGIARERIFLTSPYFIPDVAMERALIGAALRGIDVRILLPESSDVWLAGAAARSYFDVLLRAGIRLYLYQPSMLHAKTLLVDHDVCLVGSANADIRSFRLNFEVGALVRDPAFVDEAERQFLLDLEQSRELSLQSVLARGLVPRLVDSVARLMSPLL